ncbi:hypothetical protein FRC20_001077 [Serendipita sp. 405]|nr:hypothetical protein FRC20_001077 [Serendipita sp. 405]
MSARLRCLTWEPEPAIQLLSSPSSRPIKTLNDDILLHIFRSYLDTRRSIIKLLLTCSQWRDIVLRHPSLRSHIHFWQVKYMINMKRAASSGGYDSIYPHDLSLACTTPKQLAEAIERLNGASFTITFHGPITHLGDDTPSWECVPWKVFSERCTAIHTLSGGIEFPILENLPAMTSLKSIAGLPFINGGLSRILHKISKGVASPLQSLFIKAPGDLNPELFPEILARIKTFEIADDTLVRFKHDQCLRLLSSFRDLEHLRWKGDRQDANKIRELVSWRFKLKTLTITELLPSLFPFSVLESLVELTIEIQRILPIEDYQNLVSSDEDSNEDKTSITLPALAHLTLVGSWIDLLRIDAPLLQTLVLSAGKIAPNKDALYYLVHTRLRPSIVHIVDPSARGVILGGLLRGPFTDIIELKIHVSIDWVNAGRLEQFLAAPKSGKKQGQSMIVPNLRHLVVSVFSSTPSDRENVEMMTEKATRLRLESGPLLSVRCLGEEINFKLR